MMLLFWVVVIAMIVATLALILPALLKPNKTVTTDANAEKRAIFHQQFDEIEQDKANGILDAAQYEIAKTELERRMLDEIGTNNVLTGSSKPDRMLALILLIVLPLASIFIYYKIGSPAAISLPNAAQAIEASQSAEEQSARAGDVEPLLAAMNAKLAQNPADGKGWALLARTYVELGRTSDAVPAYEKAVKIIPNDAQLLADYADALAVSNGYNLAGKPTELVNQALKLDPHHIKSLLLAAAAATNRKDYKQAIVYWQNLQKELPADSDIAPKVKASLDEVYRLAGVKAPATAESATPAEATQGVSGAVKLAPALAANIDPAATVFVYARAAQGASMPLAIERITVKDLPYTYHLDDSKGLMPANKLSQAAEVVIVARISKTGDAKPQAGDLQGTSSAVKPNSSKVDVEINELLK
ncbi:c-type cytochrome biogenesis protein CcmI [Methylotenera sp.]|uniref:c-type cytochrome biogenesis protein CcmI n=1 Tax=Methylotenera sp. TaxID=2051956 RepID=UPI002487E3C4|nr:c-type cytochrome biogenesis protein CcmI [Methylotenera sp.]MDI1362867.1 c-type cytochrome biogenesis protein CcmI [Methylotenera sp.]